MSLGRKSDRPAFPRIFNGPGSVHCKPTPPGAVVSRKNPAIREIIKSFDIATNAGVKNVGERRGTRHPSARSDHPRQWEFHRNVKSENAPNWRCRNRTQEFLNGGKVQLPKTHLIAGGGWRHTSKESVQQKMLCHRIVRQKVTWFNG